MTRLVAAGLLLLAVLVLPPGGRAQDRDGHAAEHAYYFDAVVGDLVGAVRLLQRGSYPPPEFLLDVRAETSMRASFVRIHAEASSGFSGDTSLRDAAAALYAGYVETAKPVMDSLAQGRGSADPGFRPQVERFFAHVSRLVAPYQAARTAWQSRYAAAFETYLCDWAATILERVSQSPQDALFRGRSLSRSGREAPRDELSIVIGTGPLEGRSAAEDGARKAAAELLACMPSEWKASEGSNDELFWIFVAPPSGQDTTSVPPSAHFEVNVAVRNQPVAFVGPAGTTTRLIVREHQ